MSRDPMIEVELVDPDEPTGPARQGPPDRGPAGPGKDPAGPHDDEPGRRAPEPAADGTSPAPTATDPAPGPPDRARATGAARPPLRLRRRTVVALGATVVAALVATQAVLDARARADLARLAEVPGVVAPLGDGLEVLWRADAGTMFAMFEGGVVGDRGVGGRFEDTGAQSAIAVDVRTGDVAWSTPLADAEQELAGTAVLGGGPPCDVTDGGPALLVCLVGTRYARPPVAPEEYGGDLGLPTPQPQQLELVVVDATTGAVVGRTPETPRTGMVVVGDDVVTATSAADGSVDLRARDVRSGEQLWQRTLPAGSAERAWAEAGATPGLTRLGPDVLVELGFAGVRVRGDGTLVGTYPETSADVPSFVRRVRGDRLVRHVFGPRSDSVTLLGDDGAATPLPEGTLLDPQVDDGSEPDVLLLTGATDAGRGLVAWDAAAGERRWSDEELLASDALVLDGVAYLVHFDGSVRAVELRDGTTRWRTPAPTVRGEAVLASPRLLTDGRSLVVVGQGSATSAVRAYALADGSPTWEGTLPFSVEGVVVVGDHAVAWSETSDGWSVLG